MKERPILYSGPMIRALNAGTKTQTRRVLVPQPGPNVARIVHAGGTLPEYVAVGRDGRSAPRGILCPYGGAGDRLWVRETLRRTENVWRYDADGEQLRISMDDVPAMVRWAHHKQGDVCVSIHMPRWASRITLEVTSVRVERVQSISEEDAKAEGAAWRIAPGGDLAGAFDDIDVPIGFRNHFRDLWTSINGERPGCSWDANPWTWAIDFRMVPR